MKLLKTILILIVIVAVFGGAMFALDLYTGPIIDANQAGAANDRLNAVMPGGSGYEDITATLSDLPANVTTVYKETSGLGYVILCTAESNYSKAPMEITLGVSADGKISGVEINSYNDTPDYDFRGKDPNYLASYVGKDSALADIGTVSGSTFSSTAFKTAVEGAMGVLAANDLIKAGEKSPEQLLAEMIPTLHTGLTSGGLLKAETVAGSGNIVEGYKALNGSGYAFIVKNGETSVLAIVNADGACKVYDTTGADVTEANAAARDEAVAVAMASSLEFSEAAQKLLVKKFADATEITKIELTTFSNVVYACSFKTGDNTYYAFYSRPLTYGDNAMSICTVIDENGAIVNQNVEQMAFGHGVEYMPGIKDFVDATSGAFGSYLNGFNGITEGTLTDDVLVSGGTVSSSAVKLATKDAFNEFNAIKGGEQ